jgi:hypothetical protein
MLLPRRTKEELTANVKYDQLARSDLTEWSPNRIGRPEGEMKTLAVALLLAGCLVWAPFAGARDTNREAVNREWTSANAKPMTVRAIDASTGCSQAIRAASDSLPKNYAVKKIR